MVVAKPKPRLPRQVINRLRIISLIVKNPSMGNGELNRISGMPHSTFESALAWRLNMAVKRTPEGHSQISLFAGPKSLRETLLRSFHEIPLSNRA